MAGEQHAYFSLEDRSRGLRVSGAASTTALEGRGAIIEQYGREKGRTRLVQTDGGPEYKGEFHDYVVETLQAAPHQEKCRPLLEDLLLSHWLAGSPSEHRFQAA